MCNKGVHLLAMYQLLRTVNVHMINPVSSKLILQIMFFFSNNLTWERWVTVNWRELLNDICFPSSVPEIWHVRIMKKKLGMGKIKVSVSTIFLFSSLVACLYVGNDIKIDLRKRRNRSVNWIQLVQEKGPNRPSCNHDYGLPGFCKCRSRSDLNRFVSFVQKVRFYRM